MTAPNMLNRANLQPHLVNLIASLRVHHVQEAIALLLDYVDAGRVESSRSTVKPQVLKPATVEISDEQIDAIAAGMPGGVDGFLKSWGWRQFARKILDLRAPPAWEPQFDVMSPKQEALVREFCAEIAGPTGQPGRPPDPVRLLEIAQALYEAEREDCAP